jgi:hypothetical protein
MGADEESWRRCASGPDRFLAVWFSGTCFNDEVSFSDRSFDKRADFRDARFYFMPDIDWTGNFARFDFTGTEFGLAHLGKLLGTAGTKLPSLYRAMRKAAEEARDHDHERDLYIAERKAELRIRLAQWSEVLKRASLTELPRSIIALIDVGLWIAVMFLYQALADCGRNFLLPALWLILSVPLFHSGYSKILASLMPQTSTVAAAKYAHALWMVALGNTVPFVGPLTVDAEIKRLLFCTGFGNCTPIPPECFQLLVIVQNVLSIILVFFIGLALRNYFKIK